ncbi:MAG: HAD hydrolase family protein [Lachnospiraceae bacterium]|nr:HAD hydrolase family protein [Lachnospiraceae bacterium]
MRSFPEEFRKIRLIGVDLDETLLTSRKTISDAVMGAIKEAEAAGIRIVPVTGRPLAGVPAELFAPGLCRYAITSAGAVLTDFGGERGGDVRRDAGGECCGDVRKDAGRECCGDPDVLSGVGAVMDAGCAGSAPETAGNPQGGAAPSFRGIGSYMRAGTGPAAVPDTFGVPDMPGCPGTTLSYEGLDPDTALSVYNAAPELQIVREIMIDGYAYMEPELYDLLISRYYNTVFRSYIESTRIPVPDLFGFVREAAGRECGENASSGNTSSRNTSSRNAIGGTAGYIARVRRGTVENIGFLTASPEELQTLKAALARIPGIRATGYSATSLDVGAPGTDKGRALLALGARLGIGREEICAIGDSENDMPMLEAAQFAVAMGNASPRVRSAASYITATCDEDGVALVIRAVIG